LEPSGSFDEWDRFVDESPQGCLFCQSWWLQAVSPDDFQVLALRKGGRIVAGIPLVTSRSFAQTLVHMPPLTQTLGVLLSPPSKQSYVANLSAEMELLKTLVAAIPRVAYFSMNFHYNFTNWLPFYWAGYRQTTRYTYILPQLDDEKTLWAGLRSNIRTDIQKASRSNLSIETDDTPDRLYKMTIKTFSRQGAGMPYSASFFEGLDRACRERGARMILTAVDNSSRVHASAYVVWDAKSAYYLAGGADPELRNSGATSLLLWESIKRASRVTQKFDFEGSMIPSVERFFRAFGARQMPYFSITKDNRLVFFRWLSSLRRGVAAAVRGLGYRG
jgi:hypothetical protein